MSSNQKSRPRTGLLLASDVGGPSGAAPLSLGGQSSGTLPLMTIKATVKAGRLVVDEPTNLPDGTEVELLPLDPGDWLDDTDRAALHQALCDSERPMSQPGDLVDAEDILRELRLR